MMASFQLHALEGAAADTFSGDLGERSPRRRREGRRSIGDWIGHRMNDVVAKGIGIF